MIGRRAVLRGGAGLAAMVATHRAAAQEELVVAVGGAVTSADPHHSNLVPNNALALHVFDKLMHWDGSLRLQPALAVAWTPVDERAWRIDLRRGVQFHDGSPFGAADVLASFERAARPAGPSSFGFYFGFIAESRAIDDHAVEIRTREPYALLPNDLANIYIVPRAVAGARQVDFNQGRAAIGTGPYRFVEFVPGDRYVVERNGAWWGGRQRWSRVTFRLIPSAASRLAALLAGDADVADQIAPGDVDRIVGQPGLSVVGTPTMRLVYLGLDLRDTSPELADHQGRPLAVNPLQDPRVREALSLAIDRRTLTDRLLNGRATPAGQLLPDGAFGTSSKLRPDPFDLARARELLQEAGFGDGFRLGLAGSADRFVKDEQVLQAIAQMWRRIGIDARPNALPWAVLLPRMNRFEFTSWVSTWASGEVSLSLRTLLATRDPKRGLGTSNRSFYANPELDALLTRAVRLLDDDARAALLVRATELVMKDRPLLPLYFEHSLWGYRAGLRVTPTPDQYTTAMTISG